MDALLKLDQIHWQEAEERLRTACDLPMRKSRDYGGPTAATELLAQRRECLSPSLSVAYEDPLVILRGSGTFLYDAQGNAHLDCVNNICHVGHSHPAVVNAAARQAELLNTNTRYLHPLLVNYAQRIADLMPDPLQVVFFVNSGTEANELAVRLARTYTGRRDAVVVSDGYHGHSSTLINLSPYKHNGPGGHGPPEWVHTVPAPNPYRGAHQGRTVECGRAYAQYVADVCAHLTALGRGPAFFMAEPILGCGGQVVPPPGWLKNAYAHIRGVGGLCIADEIQVGFGRVGGHMWAFQGQDVVPDIVTLGKPMGNGHPIGAVVTTREIAETFANGMEFFSSFGGNPVSCAVGMAVLDVIEKEGLQAHAHHMGDFLARGFQTLAEQHAAIGDIRGQGLFMGIELVRDPLTREPAREEAAELVKALRRDRILVSLEGPDHNVIKLKPPLPFGETEANLLLAAFDRALSQLL